MLPSWNKTALDRSIRRALERADGSRDGGRPLRGPPPSGLGHRQPPLLRVVPRRGTRPASTLLARVPVLARFVSEFGAQAVPDHGRVHAPGALARPRLGRTWKPTTACRRAIFERRVPPGRYPTFDAWQAGHPGYQATLLRHHIETLRRLKYRPTGGFCVFLLADAQPAVSWSILDHQRRPKPATAPWPRPAPR